MAAKESPVVPPPPEPIPDPIELENGDSKRAPLQGRADTPAALTQGTADRTECEDETTNDEDDFDPSYESTIDSRHGEAADEEREDPIKARAQRAVVSAIGKMERFQEALQFDIVGELRELKHAVGDLPLRGRRDDRQRSHPDEDIHMQGIPMPTYVLPPGMHSPPRPSPPRMESPISTSPHRRVPRGLLPHRVFPQLSRSRARPAVRVGVRPPPPSGYPEVVVVEERRGSGDSSHTETNEEKEEILPPCLVQRLTMDDWRSRNRSISPDYYDRDTRPRARRRGASPRRFPPPGRRPRGPPVGDDEPQPDHVVKAYYRNVPTKIATPDNIATDEDFKRAYTQGRNREKPSRVEISSDILVEELQEISGVTLEDDPLIMIPPFKLLVYKWPKINARLATLKEELDGVDLELAKITSATEDTKESTEKSETTVPIEDADTVERLREAEESKRKQRLKEKEELNDKIRAKGALAKRAAHMQCLCDFIKTDLAYHIGLRLKAQEGSIDKIAFEDLYYLFTPGDIVIAAQSKSHQLYQVYSVSGGRVRLEKNNRNNPRGRSPADSDSDAYFAGSGVGTWTSLVVDTYLLAWDGERVSTLQATRRLKHFIGEKAVTDLEIYPVRFRKDAGPLREHMRLRGLKLIGCFGHKKYYGSTVERLEDTSRRRNVVHYRYGSPPPKPDRNVFEEIESDVFVDTKSYYQRYDESSPSSKLRRTRGSRRETTESFVRYERPILSGDHDLDEALTDDFISANRHLLYPSTPEEVAHVPGYTELVPYQLPAYEFRSRRWVWLNIEKVEEIDKSEEARNSGWKELVIPDKYSQLLVSLVDNHTSGIDSKKSQSLGPGAPSVQIDLVRGKGRGLIILLHGPPGSGKTSTAETIAAYTMRPLYSITCGDIGTTADEVEERLIEHTELAEKWGCVLLLDEADVFLMRRSWDDMGRNALVSVFLRHLEYYSGILFLTTNIVGVIDEAFKSRIHVALRYPSIDLESTKKIWNNVLDRIERDNATAEVRIQFNRATLLDFAGAHFRKHEQTDSTWNGRQVRNAFQIAIALGQYERLTRIKDEGLELDQALKSKNKNLSTVYLTKRNFLNIASTARDFEDYITSIRGSDSSVAKASMHRDDDYGRGYQKAQKAYPMRGAEQPQERPPLQPQARGGAARDAYATPTSAGRGARPAREDVRMSGGRRREEEEEMFEEGLMDDEDDEFETKGTNDQDEFEDV